MVWVVGAETHDGSESLSPFKQAIFFNEACDLRLHDTMLYEKNGVAYPARPSGNRYTQCFEYMFVFSKGKPKTAHLISDKKNRWVGWKSFGQLTERLYTGELVKYEKDHGVPEFSPRYNIWRYPNEVALLPEDDETLFPVYDEIWKYATGGNFTSSFPLAKRHPACFPESLVIDHLRTWTEESDVVLDPFNGVGTTTVVAAWMNRHFIGIDLSREYCDIAQKRLDPKYRIDIVKRIEQSKRFNNSRYPQDEHRYVGKTRKGSS